MIGKFDFRLLKSVSDLVSIPDGAYNIRKNGASVSSNSTENVKIALKSNKPGIDAFILPNAKNETVRIPVIITKSGVSDLVYNDFYIGENADITIIAGCGIRNCGKKDSEHDGVHFFHIGKGARVKYVEKHYGEGDGEGKRILNPVTVVEQDENSVCEIETVQIKGVDSTVRDTKASLKAGAKITITEKLVTHGNQSASSDAEVRLDGDGSSARIISRSVAMNSSRQIFRPNAVGNARCQAHVQCDSIIMDDAKIISVPAITANSADARIIHEAAIGRINNDQLIKLMTFGLEEQEAEEIIINGFLK